MVALVVEVLLIGLGRLRSLDILPAVSGRDLNVRIGEVPSLLLLFLEVKRDCPNGAEDGRILLKSQRLIS